MITESSVRLYQYGYDEIKTYLLAVAFVIGNVALPQLFHTIPKGGMIWLPIYFFTLIGAFKYGWRVGLLTAIASPIVNHLFFGMPMAAALPAILTKSILLALGAGFIAKRAGKVSLLAIAGVVAFYQVFGSIAEWAYTGSIAAAAQDVRLGLPGILTQIIGGYLVIRYLIKK